MKKALFAVLFFIVVFAANARAQDVDGRYTVGSTSCTIESTKMAYYVYWNEGTGYTILHYTDTLPNGNVVFNEYEDDDDTYTGKFVFKDDTYSSGTYTRNDGKKFTVKKRY